MEGSISIGAIDPSCFDISAQVVVDSSGQEKKYKFSRSELRLRP